ncbi:hypothetical protein BT69DRAFT_1295285 [Atractiella rhizophila]|nr:hypothetical protein BT69DRAFT_1295285 [Atractiella rhizophila]
MSRSNMKTLPSLFDAVREKYSISLDPLIKEKVSMKDPMECYGLEAFTIGFNGNDLCHNVFPRQIYEEVFSVEQYKKILDYRPRPGGHWIDARGRRGHRFDEQAQGEGAVDSPAVEKDCSLFTPGEKPWEKDQLAAPKLDSQLEGQPSKAEKILGFPPPPGCPLNTEFFIGTISEHKIPEEVVNSYRKDDPRDRERRR